MRNWNKRDGEWLGVQEHSYESAEEHNERVQAATAAITPVMYFFLLLFAVAALLQYCGPATVSVLTWVFAGIAYFLIFKVLQFLYRFVRKQFRTRQAQRATR